MRHSHDHLACSLYFEIGGKEEDQSSITLPGIVQQSRREKVKSIALPILRRDLTFWQTADK